MSQSKKNGGLELGATATSVIFLIAILAVILLLAVTKLDLIPRSEEVKNGGHRMGIKKVWLQSITTIVVLLVVGIGGYSWCNRNLVPQVDSSQTTLSGQLNDFIQIENDIQNSITSNDRKSAKSEADDLEHSWDNSEPKLRKMVRKTWTQIDGTIDNVLAAVRSKNQDTEKCHTVLTDSLHVLQSSNL